MLLHPDSDSQEFRFVCDICNQVAAQHADESVALKAARSLTGWKWHHPGWGLKCPECLAWKARRYMPSNTMARSEMAAAGIAGRKITAPR